MKERKLLKRIYDVMWFSTMGKFIQRSLAHFATSYEEIKAKSQREESCISIVSRTVGGSAETTERIG